MFAGVALFAYLVLAFGLVMVLSDPVPARGTILAVQFIARWPNLLAFVAAPALWLVGTRLRLRASVPIAKSILDRWFYWRLPKLQMLEVYPGATGRQLYVIARRTALLPAQFDLWAGRFFSACCASPDGSEHLLEGVVDDDGNVILRRVRPGPITACVESPPARHRMVS